MCVISVKEEAVLVREVKTIINPRRACEARVTVVVLSFRPSSLPSVRLSVTTFSAATRKKTAISDTNGFSAILALFFKWHFL